MCDPNNNNNLIDVAIPGDSRLSQKALEKWIKYMDLRIEGVEM